MNITMKKILFCIALSLILLTACSATANKDVNTKNNTIINEANTSTETVHNDTVYNVPIIMYHNVKAQRVGEYCVNPEEFEGDLVFLKERGFTVVTVSELIRFVNGGFEMPDKPIVLTFDDGRYNNYTQAFPLLKKYNCKASFFIIGSFCEKYCGGRRQYEQSSYLSFADIKEMAGSGLCDIQSHSYDLHDWTKGRTGVNKKKDEALDEYRKVLEDDLNKNQELLKKNCGIAPNAFAYPFGAYNPDAEKIISDMGFSAILTTGEGINEIRRGDKDALLRLKRFNRPHGVSCAAFLEQKIASAILIPARASLA